MWPGDASYSFAAFLCALWSVADDRTGLSAPRALPIGADAIPARVLTMLDWTLRQRRDRHFCHDAEAVWTATPPHVGDVAGWPSLGWEWLLAFGEHLDRVRSKMDEEVQRGRGLRNWPASTNRRSGIRRPARLLHDEHVAAYERLHGEYKGAIAGYRPPPV